MSERIGDQADHPDYPDHPDRPADPAEPPYDQEAPPAAPAAPTAPAAPVARRRRRRTRRRRRVLPVLLALLLVLGIIVGGGFFFLSRLVGGAGSAPDFAGSGDGTPARVQVHDGDTSGAIAATLVDAGVVKSRTAFSRAAAADPRSRGIQPGFYRLQHQMSAAAALAGLLDPASRLRGRVTIPEGSSLAGTLALLAAKTEVPRADLTAAVRAPQTLGLPPYAKGRVEGFLFPATYDIQPGTSARDALRLLTSRFIRAAGSSGLEQGSAALGMTPYQVVTVASLVEREAAAPADRPKVARVIYNRLKQGTALGLESTLRYALGNVTDQRLKQSQIDKAALSPYDTYSHTGLPPGPIANPGEAALEAALHPAVGDYTYFVTLPKDNKTVFTARESEFNALVAQCRSQGGC